MFRETLITPEDFSHLFNLIYRFNPTRTIPDELPDNELGENLRNDFKKRGLLIEEEEEEQLSPQQKTRMANKQQTAKLMRQEAHLKSVEEKEKLKLKLEQEKKQKKHL